MPEKVAASRVGSGGKVTIPAAPSVPKRPAGTGKEAARGRHDASDVGGKEEKGMAPMSNKEEKGSEPAADAVTEKTEKEELKKPSPGEQKEKETETEKEKQTEKDKQRQGDAASRPDATSTRPLKSDPPDGSDLFFLFVCLLFF